MYSTSERNRRMKVRQTPKFKSTNAIWNQLSLNHAWCIGYLTKLYKMKKFKSHQEWENFYFESGAERLRKISRLSGEKQILLKDFAADTSNFNKMSVLTSEEINLNKYSGRTEKELYLIAEYMRSEIVKRGNKMHIKLSECVDFVKIRVLDEISIGIEREVNTMAKLQSFYPNLTFKEVPVDFDSKYCVDCEVYDKGNLILAIQIKSDKYKHDESKMLKETKLYNLDKNRRYKEKYGVDVMYVYSAPNGYIEDFSSIKKINSYIN